MWCTLECIQYLKGLFDCLDNSGKVMLYRLVSINPARLQQPALFFTAYKSVNWGIVCKLPSVLLFGVFAVFTDLHIFQSKSGANPTRTAHADKVYYHWLEFIPSEFSSLIL